MTSMTTELELVNDMIRIINKGWCQENYYVDDKGVEVVQPDGEDDVAACCIHGALIVARKTHFGSSNWAGMQSIGVANKVYDLLAQQLGHVNIVAYNDAPERTKEDVLELLGKIKAELESEEVQPSVS